MVNLCYCPVNNALLEEAKPDPNEHINILRDQRRMSLYILNKEIIEHTLTLEHLQKLKDKSDWNFLKAFTDVDKINTDCITKLRTTTNINEEIEDLIKDYAKFVVVDTKSESSGWICLTCQVNIPCFEWKNKYFRPVNRIRNQWKRLFNSLEDRDTIGRPYSTLIK